MAEQGTLIASRAQRFASKSLRATTAPLRRLPDFLVIGVMKAATSSLFGYLQQHPRIAGPYKKEVHYFDSGFQHGPLWYRAHFPLEAAGIGRRCLTGEATPSYILNPHAPARIRRTLGEVPLVLILRDPVGRAFSHYRHMVRVGREPLDFAKAIDNESLVDSEFAKVLADPAYPDALLRDKSYLLRGRYLEQIRRYLTHFDRSRLHIIVYQDFVARPQETMQELCRFLELEPFTFDCGRRHNVGISGEMAPQVRARLEDYFRQPNAELYDFLGRDLKW